MSDDNDQVNESGAAYEPVPAKKIITFFNSFEEAEEHGLKEMASHSYEQRLANLEVIRSRNFREKPPFKNILTIIKATYK